jgi:hypothetical protein
MGNLAGTYTKSYISIPCTESVSGIAYIMYVQNEKNGKPNNLKVVFIIEMRFLSLRYR